MVYFLKKTTPTKKGVYLQIYITYYDPETKKKKQKCYKSLGYVSDLTTNEIKDPVEYYTKQIIKMNKELLNEHEIKIGTHSTSKNIGYYLVKAMFDLLDMDETINIFSSSYKTKYKFNEMFRALCYSQIISPGSKFKAYEQVIPNIYGINSYSYDQILDSISFIGSNYHKFIEILNHNRDKHWKVETGKVYFDCTNYYFEIDLEKDYLKKGPSKENKKSPLLGQALLLDSNQIPIDTRFYPGNGSEKPLMRERIEELKKSNNINGKVIQVADKGLNCARNIYAAVIEAKDGYIFSKSLKGTSLTKEQKEWVLRSDDDLNKWVEVRDRNNNLLYRYKTVKYRNKKNEVKEYGKYSYHFLENEGTNEEKKVEFEVKEMRIVTYNPLLAKKQKHEIRKEVEKLQKCLTYKEITKEELGDKSKFLSYEAKDEAGNKIKVKPFIDQNKVEEALKFAGYNLLVTSEFNEKPTEIYKTYHNLWRIEESFRVLKTYLEARPVYLSKEYSIYGHFLICYVSLTIMRLIELKIFNDKITIGDLFEYIRNFNVTKNAYEEYINTSTMSDTCLKIKEVLGLSKIDNLYLQKRDLDLLLKTEFEDPLDE